MPQTVRILECMYCRLCWSEASRPAVLIMWWTSTEYDPTNSKSVRKQLLSPPVYRSWRYSDGRLELPVMIVFSGVFFITVSGLSLYYAPLQYVMVVQYAIRNCLQSVTRTQITEICTCRIGWIKRFATQNSKIVRSIFIESSGYRPTQVTNCHFIVRDSLNHIAAE